MRKNATSESQTTFTPLHFSNPYTFLVRGAVLCELQRSAQEGPFYEKYIFANTSKYFIIQSILY